MKSFFEKGLSLVEVLVAFALLGGLALGLIRYVELNLKGTHSSKALWDFERLAGAVSISLEAPGSCISQLGDVHLNSVLGVNKGPIKLSPSGYPDLTTASTLPVFGQFFVTEIELESVKVLELDSEAYDVHPDQGAPDGGLSTVRTLSLLRLKLEEKSSVKSRTLGGSVIKREFYVATQIDKMNFRVLACRSGRWVAEENLNTPSIAALPKGVGLMARISPVIKLAPGTEVQQLDKLKWVNRNSCEGKGGIFWVQNKVFFRGPKELAKTEAEFRWLPAYPTNLLELGDMIPVGGVFVDPATISSISSYSVMAATNPEGVYYQYACFGIGAP